MVWLLAFFLGYTLVISGLGKNRPAVLYRLSEKASLGQVATSLLTASVGVPLVGIISSAVVTQGEVGFWFIASGLLGSGFLIWIYGPIWTKLNLPHENQLISLRFREPWSGRLLWFRGWYVGAVVGSILLAIMIQAFSNMLSILLSVKALYVQWACLGFLLVQSVRSSLSQQQSANWLQVLLLSILLAGGIVIVLVSPTSVSSGTAETSATLGSFPYSKSIFVFPFWAYIGLQWWSAATFDGSGVAAQRIMGLSERRGRLALLIFYTCMAVIIAIISWLAWRGQAYLQPQETADSAVFALFRNLWPASRIVLALLVMPLFIGVAEAQLNWAGSLIASTWKNPRPWQPRGAMVLLLCITTLLTMTYSSVAGLFQLFLGVSAGLSLLFMLRWWTPYINAQVQLFCMIGAVVFSALSAMLFRMGIWQIPESDQYAATLLLVTVCNVLLAVVTALFTYRREDYHAFRSFRQQLAYSLPDRQSLLKAVLTGSALAGLSYAVWRALLWL